MGRGTLMASYLTSPRWDRGVGRWSSRKAKGKKDSRVLGKVSGRGGRGRCHGGFSKPGLQA